jgi:hypothetical protein
VAAATDAGGGFTSDHRRIGSQQTRTEATENAVVHGTLTVSDERDDARSNAVEPTFSDRVAAEVSL